MTNAALELAFRAQDKTVHHVRLMVQNFAMLSTGDHAYSSRITVTCAELVETIARRLSAACTLSVDLNPFDQSARAQLSVESNERESKEILALVDAASRGSPLDAYTSALTAQGKDQELILGLSRIRYEGQMALTCRREGSRTIVAAQCAPKLAAAPTSSRVEAVSRYRAPAAPWAEMRASATTGPDRS